MSILFQIGHIIQSNVDVKKGTLLAAVLPLLGPLCSGCSELLSGQVSLTQGVLTGLSRVVRSGPVVMDWQVPLVFTNYLMQDDDLAGHWCRQAARWTQGGGAESPLQRRRERPGHDCEPRHQYQGRGRRHKVRVSGKIFL